MKKCSALLLILTLLCGAFPTKSLAEKISPPDCPAGAAILIEKEERRTLFSKNEHLPLPPASTTKIMTAIIVIENCAPDEIVTIPKESVGTEGSSAYLRCGEQLTVLDLLYCLMLRSANDAAVALAFHTAGTVEDFVKMMNDKAKALGLSNSHFENPHGLDHSNHYMSAFDLGTLSAYCLDNSLFCSIVSTKSISVGMGENQRQLTNHNKLLFSLTGCIGVKTGYTIRSGRCLVTACKKNDTVLICVTINCRPDWNTHTALYDYGFSLVKRTVFDGFDGDLAVAGSNLTVHVSSDRYSLLSVPEDRVEFAIVCPHLLFAPITTGAQVGQVRVLLNGNVIDVLPILAREDISLPPAPGLLSKIFSFLLSIFQKK